MACYGGGYWDGGGCWQYTPTPTTTAPAGYYQPRCNSAPVVASMILPSPARSPAACPAGYYRENNATGARLQGTAATGGKTSKTPLQQPALARQATSLTRTYQRQPHPTATTTTTNAYKATQPTRQQRKQPQRECRGSPIRRKKPRLLSRCAAPVLRVRAVSNFQKSKPNQKFRGSQVGRIRK